MRISLQEIYDRSPVAIQQLMTSISGYQRNRSRYGRTYREYRKWLEQFDKWSLDDKLAYQTRTLVSFVNKTATTSRFYRHLYEGLDVQRLTGVDDLKRLPIVDKEMLRTSMNDVHTVPSRGAIEGHTGGTTGKSLVVLVTPTDMMKRMAQLDHFKSRCGFEHRKMRRATFSGKHIIPVTQKSKKFWRYNRACRQMLYSTFHIADANLAVYVESLNRFKPHALDGFFTSMVDVASYIERNNLQLTFSPVAIFPTSETVTASGREQLERVFGCPVFDQYASSEGAPFVTECRESKLHVELNSGVFESLDNGEVLVTSFTTTGTPLIRYRIGDSMTFSPNTECACGISSPQVLSIEGRKDDYLYRADGVKVNSVNIANLFKNMPNALVKAQLIQEEMNEVTMLLVVDAAQYLDEYDDVLRDEFEHKFGHETRVDIRHVDDIPREVSGKYRLIVNNLAPNLPADS